MEFRKADAGILLPRQHQQRGGILLRAPLRSLDRVLRDKHDRPVVRGLPLSIDGNRRREKLGIRIAALVTMAGGGCADVRWHSLCVNRDPVAVDCRVTLAWELQHP